jgi:hypothetical protein
MASDVTLHIADPKTGAMVYVRWMGMSRTIETARAVLVRPADHQELRHDPGAPTAARFSALEAAAGSQGDSW